MKLTDVPPVCCSSCFQQQPEKLHVDMEAAWEGPLLDVDGRRFSIDDLWLCEDCIRAAVALLPENRRREEALAEAVAAYRQLIAYCETLQTANEQLTQNLAAKLEPLKSAAGSTPQRRKPKPQGVVV